LDPHLSPSTSSSTQCTTPLAVAKWSAKLPQLLYAEGLNLVEWQWSMDGWAICTGGEIWCAHSHKIDTFCSSDVWWRVLAYRYRCFGAANCWHLGLLQRRMQYAPQASINPTPRPYLGGIVDLYSVLPWVMSDVVTVVEVIPWWELLDTHWLTGLWSTQAKVDSIVPKAAMHWGRDSNVVNDPLGGTRPRPNRM
jgi:hypothetical protein